MAAEASPAPDTHVRHATDATTSDPQARGPAYAQRRGHHPVHQRTAIAASDNLRALSREWISDFSDFVFTQGVFPAAGPVSMRDSFKAGNLQRSALGLEPNSKQSLASTSSQSSRRKGGVRNIECFHQDLSGLVHIVHAIAKGEHGKAMSLILDLCVTVGDGGGKLLNPKKPGLKSLKT